MTNEQLYLAIEVPIIINTVFNLLLFFSLNKRIDDLRDSIDRRFILFEQVIDARLKNLEEKVK